MIQDERDLELERHFADAPVHESFFVDWTTFWNRGTTAEDWVVDDVFARGRGHAVFAEQKQGKSLLTLCLIAEAVTKDPTIFVVYLDYEMTEDDLYERLEEMGYGPSSDLGRLHYALLPTLPPLDTGAGATEFMSVIDGLQRVHPGLHPVVVIDTTSRAVQGDENSADTIRAFYRHTGMALKQRGATWARLDHAGKDPSKGQRGSSAKGDDVDVVWQLQRTDQGVMLKRHVARMSWVPEKVVFHRKDDPSGDRLGFIRVAGDWPAGTADAATELDDIGVPVNVSVRDAITALKERGRSRRKQTVAAAVRFRKQPEYTRNHPRNHLDDETGNQAGNRPPRNRPLPGPEPLSEPPGTTRAGKEPGGGSLKGTHPGEPGSVSWNGLGDAA